MAVLIVGILVRGGGGGCRSTSISGCGVGVLVLRYRWCLGGGGVMSAALLHSLVRSLSSAAITVQRVAAV